MTHPLFTELLPAAPPAELVEALRLPEGAGRSIVEYLLPKVGGDVLMAALAKTSFYTDPASIQKHRSYPGGLVEHKLAVLFWLLRLAESMCKPNDASVTASNVVRIALCHDLCKVGTYQRTMKSQKIKNPDGSYKTKPGTDKLDWEDVWGYEHKTAKLPLGHGEASVVLGLRLGLDLTPPEMLAIRWHMGGYDTSSDFSVSSAQRDAMGLHPLVIATQTADLMDTYYGADRPVAEPVIRALWPDWIPGGTP